MSTPNLAKDMGGAEARRSVLMAPKQQPYPQHHARSTSYSVQSVTAKVNPGKLSGYSNYSVGCYYQQRSRCFHVKLDRFQFKIFC